MPSVLSKVAYPDDVVDDINPVDLVTDALQYHPDAGVFILVPNDGNVVDFRLSYELGLFSREPLLQDGLNRIVMVLANVPLMIRAMQAWRLENPNRLMILRIYTVVPTTFLQPADKMILPAMMGPMCVIGRGRPSGQGVKAGTQPMLATLHFDCSFDGVPFSKHMQDPKNGFFVSGVAFAQTTSELMWQCTAGGILAFTTVVLCGPLVASLAGFGVALGALYIPAGTTLKYIAGAVAGRIGGWIASTWSSRPHLIEPFRVPNQQPFRRIMARDVYGMNSANHLPLLSHLATPYYDGQQRLYGLPRTSPGRGPCELGTVHSRVEADLPATESSALERGWDQVGYTGDQVWPAASEFSDSDCGFEEPKGIAPGAQLEPAESGSSSSEVSESEEGPVSVSSPPTYRTLSREDALGFLVSRHFCPCGIICKDKLHGPHELITNGELDTMLMSYHVDSGSTDDQSEKDYKPREYTVVDIHQPPVSAPLPDEPEAANPASKGKFKRFCKNLVKSKKQPRAALMVE